MKLLFMVLVLLLSRFAVPDPSFAPERSIDWVAQVKQAKQFQQEQLRKERIETLLYVIRMIESNNRYHVWGSSGEYGAYQFMPQTWHFYCSMFVGEYLDIRDAENQDLIARTKISYYVDQGYNDKEIAAIWNSGSAKGWENKIGVNSHGIHYNVPAYVCYFVSLVKEHNNQVWKT